MGKFTAIEICAGAGGQALGLHRAGFEHVLAVELDATAAETLRNNLKGNVVVGDVADRAVWDPSTSGAIDLLAGGVPCPPFSIAGKQLGSADERDLFAWAVETAGEVQPRALLLENVRGLAAARFASYRQRIVDRLAQLGYVADWRLLRSADFGVAQLRPRFVLVALSPEDAPYFRWPEPVPKLTTVGGALRDLMAANGWPHVDDWVELANGIGPTLVGGSKKHGGADLGPTRAKQAWAALAVDAKGVADAPPGPDFPHPSVQMPRLTIDMVARLQGWKPEDKWVFAGRKTSQYRQIGNAFPPPVAEAVGRSIRAALNHEGVRRDDEGSVGTIHDTVYRALSTSTTPLTMRELIAAHHENSEADIERRLALLAQDFELSISEGPSGLTYQLGDFKGFTGQVDHWRHTAVRENSKQIS